MLTFIFSVVLLTTATVGSTSTLGNHLRKRKATSKLKLLRWTSHTVQLLVPYIQRNSTQINVTWEPSVGYAQVTRLTPASPCRSRGGRSEPEPHYRVTPQRLLKDTSTSPATLWCDCRLSRDRKLLVRFALHFQTAWTQEVHLFQQQNVRGRDSTHLK